MYGLDKSSRHAKLIVRPSVLLHLNFAKLMNECRLKLVLGEHSIIFNNIIYGLHC